MKKQTNKYLFIIMFTCVLAINWLLSASSLGQPGLRQYGDHSGMLDFRFFYTQSEAASSLLALGPEGSALYTRILLLDFIFIVSIAYVLGELMRILIRWLKLPEKYNRLSWISYARSILDGAENLLILIALAVLPSGQGLLSIAGIVTALKFIMIGAYLAAVVFLLILRLLNRSKHI